MMNASINTLRCHITRTKVQGRIGERAIIEPTQGQRRPIYSGFSVKRTVKERLEE